MLELSILLIISFGLGITVISLISKFICYKESIGEYYFMFGTPPWSNIYKHKFFVNRKINKKLSKFKKQTIKVKCLESLHDSQKFSSEWKHRLISSTKEFKSGEYNINNYEYFFDIMDVQ